MTSYSANQSSSFRVLTSSAGGVLDDGRSQWRPNIGVHSTSLGLIIEAFFYTRWTLCCGDGDDDSIAN